jgi:hypothetical protein
MKKCVLSLVVVIASGFSSLSYALSIDSRSVHPVIDGVVYRGGVNVKQGTYGKPVTDFSYACEMGFTMVVNAYSRAKPVQVTCPDGRPVVYLGDHWDTAVSAADAFVADEIRNGGKVLVHCVNGVDASQQVAYIVAAKAGLLSAEEAAERFRYAPAGVPHAGKMENYVLQRGR